MRYNGPHAAHVNEVIDFFSSDRLLAGRRGGKARPTARVLTDIVKAVAFNTDANFAVDAAGESDEDFQYYWGDLLDNLAAELIYTSEWYGWQKKHKRTWEKLAWPFQNATLEHPAAACRRSSSATSLKRYVRYSGSAENRASEIGPRTTSGNRFWRHLEGLWPCGWEGRCPNPGALLVCCKIYFTRLKLAHPRKFGS